LRTATLATRAQTLQLEQEATALNLLAETTQRFIQVLSAQQTVILLDHSTELAEQTLASVQRRVSAGATTRIELLRAQAALANEQTRLLQARNAQAIAKIRLASVWGDSIADFDQVTGDLFDVGGRVDETALAQQLNNNPALLLASSKAELLIAEQRQVLGQSSPDLRWTLGARHFQDTSDTALVAGISLPLFSGSRNNGRTQVANAQLMESKASRDITLLTMQSRLLEFARHHDSALQQVIALQQHIIPLLQEALTDATNAYDRGRYSYLEMVEARKELVTAQQQLIDAATDALLIRTDIEKITANTLPSMTSAPNQTVGATANTQEKH